MAKNSVTRAAPKKKTWLSERVSRIYRCLRGCLPPLCDRSFPPKLHVWKLALLGVIYISVLGALVIVADQLWFKETFLLESCRCWAYSGMGIALVGIVFDRYLRHKVNVHKSRLEDPSVVRASIVEARTVEPRLIDPLRPEAYPKKKTNLTNEVYRLEEIGQYGWTEFQILPLKQMLVEFLKLDDLKALSASGLDELEEYAQDSAFRYDSEFYSRWKGRIDEANKKLVDPKDLLGAQDQAAEPLRAELRMLLDHVADYQANWKEGSTILGSLRIGGVVAVVIFLLMGLVPILHPLVDSSQQIRFGVLNWGLFGISGSLIAVLRDLRNSNLAEVGNTEGKMELARTVLGCALGLVAGILTYAMVGGGLLVGSAFPKIESNSLMNVSLSIFVGLASGYAFERVFDRLQNANNQSQ